MKIALLGYGKMGKMIERTAIERGHHIVAKFSCNFPINESLDEADICIDFSHPDCFIENLRKAAEAKKNIVAGTTGWYEFLPAVKEIVLKHSVGLLYSPNFSLGVHLFLRIVEEAANIMKDFSQYDTGVIEAHHNQKVDAPSGTAKYIAKTLTESMKKEIPISSLRCGSIPGIHTVCFDSSADTITLQHSARNREGFAQGAVIAAEWLQGKKGLFTLDDL